MTPRHDLTGQTLGQYQLRGLIGVGGMGAVYRAYQAALSREVALKVLSEELAAQPGYLERFTREAKTAAALEHPHIVPVYDYGAQQDLIFVVMRLLTGGSLADRLDYRAAHGLPLPAPGEIGDLLSKLAGALDYAHQLGIIHRDIKPSNIMFDNHGTPFIVDFGIAKLLGSQTALTQAGAAVGTPGFMSPEQWRGEDLGPATDQYGLAVMVYLLLTGHVPFEAPTPYALMHKHLNEMPTPAHFERRDVPEAVTPVLERALAKVPGERFETVTAFVQAFGRAIEGLEGQATQLYTLALPKKAPPRPPTPEKSAPPAPASLPSHRRQAIAGALLLVLGVILGTALALVIRHTDEEKPTLTPTILVVGGDVATPGESWPTPSPHPTRRPTLDLRATDAQATRNAREQHRAEQTAIATRTASPTASATPSAPPSATRTPTITRTPRPTALPVVNLQTEGQVFYSEFDRPLNAVYTSIEGGRTSQHEGQLWLEAGETAGLLRVRVADSWQRYTLYLRVRMVRLDDAPHDAVAWVWTFQGQVGQCDYGYTFHLHDGFFLTQEACGTTVPGPWLDSNEAQRWRYDHWYDLYLTVDAPTLRLWLDGQRVLENTKPLPHAAAPPGALVVGVAPGFRLEIDRLFIGPPERVGQVIAGTLTCGRCQSASLRTDLPPQVLAAAGVRLGSRVLVATRGHVIEALVADSRDNALLDAMQPLVLSRAGLPLRLTLNDNGFLYRVLEAGDGEPLVLVLPPS